MVVRGPGVARRGLRAVAMVRAHPPGAERPTGSHAAPAKYSAPSRVGGPVSQSAQSQQLERSAGAATHSTPEALRLATRRGAVTRMRLGSFQVASGPGSGSDVENRMSRRGCRDSDDVRLGESSESDVATRMMM
jgi:hypothetical protein